MILVETQKRKKCVKLKSYLKCNICGYIGEKNRIKDVCPACGAPVTSLESYAYGISEKRSRRLNMHLHPILVHFPICLTVFSFVFIVLAFLSSGPIRNQLIVVEKFVSIILPFFIIATMGAGIFDAKTRILRSVSRIRKQKIQLSSYFLVFSGVAAVLINYEVFSVLGKSAILLLCFLDVLFSAILSNKGTALLNVIIKD